MIYEILFDFFQLFHCFIIILILFMKNWLENHKHFFIFCYQLHLILYLESLLMDSIVSLKDTYCQLKRIILAES